MHSNMEMELNHLTEEERDRILSVLRRDQDLKRKDTERIRNLKADVKAIRLKGVIKAGIDPDKTCARCRAKFGWLFNKGATCPQCQHRVCDNCKTPVSAKEPSKWLCVLCHKQMELDAMSGQWFLMKFRKSKRNKKTNKVITGQEIVIPAIMKSPPMTDDEDGEEGVGGGGVSGGGGPEVNRPTPGEEGRRSFSNNNSSPKSSRSAGSASVGEESSDTQSTASTSTSPKRGTTTDIHDVGFPKESDKQRLFDLIRSKAPSLGKDEQQQIQKPTVEVRKVSLSRYRSDSSDSSSSSDPSSPQLSARTESDFRYSDSVRSSIRSSGAFSGISSEGRITIVTESNVSDIETNSYGSFQSNSTSQNDSHNRENGDSSRVTVADMYDKDSSHCRSSDSVIENVPHRTVAAKAAAPTSPSRSPGSPSPAKSTAAGAGAGAVGGGGGQNPAGLRLAAVRTDTPDGSMILADTEVTIRRVISSKHVDSMSSDSDATDDLSTEPQSHRVKTRRITAGRGGGGGGQGGSRTPSPEPRSKARHADMPGNALSSPENKSNMSELTQSGVALDVAGGARDGQAGGDTNTAAAQGHGSTLASPALSHNPPLSVSRSHHNNKPNSSDQETQLQETPRPPHPAAAGDAADPGKSAPSSETPPHGIRAKVGALLAKYGRRASPPPTEDGLRSADRDEALSSSSSSSNSSSPRPAREESRLPVLEDGSSFEVLDDESANSSFEELLWWEADGSPQNVSSNSDDTDWERLRVAVAANMAQNAKSEEAGQGIFLDEVDSPDHGGGGGGGKFNDNWGRRQLSQDDLCSDTLSVITEITEPDDDFYQFDSLKRFSPKDSVRFQAHTAAPAANDDRDHGYFTLPGRGAAVSRTESMRSAAEESDPSRKSVSPSSDVETDLSLSQFSEASATESIQDCEWKRSNAQSLPGKSSGGGGGRDNQKKGSLDDLLLTADTDSEASLIDLDEMYWLNLQHLQEADLVGLSLPTDGSLKPPRSDPLPRRSHLKGPAVLRLSDRKKKTDSLSGIQQLTAIFEGEQTVYRKRESFPPRKHPSTTEREGLSGRQRRPRSESEIELLNVQDETDHSVSPHLQRKRAELRAVSPGGRINERRGDRQRRKEGKVEEPVDESHLASISDLTKIFDKPPPYMFSHRTDDTDDLKKGDSSNEIQSEDLIQRETARATHSQPASAPAQSETKKSPGRKSTTQTPVVEPVSKQRDSKVKQEKEKSKREKKETKERVKEEKLRRTEQEKQDKLDKQKTKKQQVKSASQGARTDRIDRSIAEPQATEPTTTNTREKSHGERTDNSSKSQSLLEPGAGKSGLEETARLNRRAPSPTVQAVREKVGASKSVQVRQIICEELEREVLENVSDVDSYSSRSQARERRKGREDNLSMSPKDAPLTESASYSQQRVTALEVTPKKDRSPRPSARPTSWSSTPSDVELEVQQQLEDWKRKRESRRTKVSPSRQQAADDPGRREEPDTGPASPEKSPQSELRTGATLGNTVARRADLAYESHFGRYGNLEEAPAGAFDKSSSVPTDPFSRESDDKTRVNKDITPPQGGGGGGGGGSGGGETSNDVVSPRSTDLNDKVSDSSYELEEAFLQPRAPGPGEPYREELRHRPPAPALESAESDDEFSPQVDTESTLTPDTEPLDPVIIQSFAPVVAIGVGEEEEEDEEEEEEDHDSVDEEESQPEELDEYELSDHERLSYGTHTTGSWSVDSIGRSSLCHDDCYSGSSSGGRGGCYCGGASFSGGTPETASLRSSACSSQYSPGSNISRGSADGAGSDPRRGGARGGGGGGARRVAGVVVVTAGVSYESLDVHVDEDSDTAEERANPAKVEEDFTLSLNLGPRPEPYLTSIRSRRTANAANALGANCSNSGEGPFLPGSNPNVELRRSKPHPTQSVPHAAEHQTDNRHPNGQVLLDDTRDDASSLSGSDVVRSHSPAPSVDRASNSTKKSSSSRVPSINVTHHDNQPAEVVAEQQQLSDQGAASDATPSVTEGEEEEQEDIDELVASHTSPTHSVHSQKGSNLLSPFSGSKESIVSFYSDAGEGNYGNIPISGDIQLALNYNYKTGSLEVKIRQCRDLAPVETKKKRSDPYVKVYLLPDKTKSGKRKTRVKKHTLNPVFDEILKYAITKSELETRTLWITVWHSDMFGRNDFLGEVTIPLNYHGFDDPTFQWYKLQERTRDKKKRAISLENLLGGKKSPAPPEDENASPMSLLTYNGDLILSLKYVTADNISGGGAIGASGGSGKAARGGSGKRRPGRGELHVLLKEARNLTAVRANGFSDPFCKGYLLPDKGRNAKQKTPVVKRDCNPQWNHTLVFDDVSLDDLRERSLELTVWDHDRFTSNDFLGGLRLNLGTSKCQTKEVDWMDSRGEEVSMWQAMLDRPNCWIDGSLLLRTTMERRK